MGLEMMWAGFGMLFGAGIIYFIPLAQYGFTPLQACTWGGVILIVVSILLTVMSDPC
jgi:hypothetical protein